MRISTAFKFGIPFIPVVILYFLNAGWLMDTYERVSSGVIGKSGNASSDVTTTASISPLDGYDYPGQLDATISFTDAGGATTVFDLHYPTDYTLPHDELGALWLNNWHWDLANNPQVTPVLANSCLQPSRRNDNLATSVRYQTGYREYIVCRVLDEVGSDAPSSYDITQAKPAVIGVMWANKNHQPMDYPRERCVAEMRIWSTEIATSGDRFMACVFVIAEEPQHVDIYAFELTEDRIIEVGGKGESWSRATVDSSEPSRLVQYRMMQEWLENPDAHDAAIERAYTFLADNIDQVEGASRVTELDRIERANGKINMIFNVINTAEIRRLANNPDFDEEPLLYQNIRNLVCSSDERRALMAFQTNRPAFKFDLYRSNGEWRVLNGTFWNRPC